MPLSSPQSITDTKYYSNNISNLSPYPEELLPTLHCGECISTPPLFSKTVSPFIYEFPLKPIIHQIKYSQKRYWVKPLAKLMTNSIKHTYCNDQLPDLLIPIPIHKQKKTERGFNQSALICRKLSKQLKLAESHHTLIKVKQTNAQANLSKAKRLQNLKGSFDVKNRHEIKGKHIAIIDDVMTTKATAELSSKLLIDAGAKRVDVWCIARTPKINHRAIK
jgi:ComF family protein